MVCAGHPACQGLIAEPDPNSRLCERTVRQKIEVAGWLGGDKVWKRGSMLVFIEDRVTGATDVMSGLLV